LGAGIAQFPAFEDNQGLKPDFPSAARVQAEAALAEPFAAKENRGETNFRQAFVRSPHGLERSNVTSKDTSCTLDCASHPLGSAWHG
jgi:hypothetical protein